VNVSRFAGKIGRGENALLPDLLDAFVEFTLRLYLADETHLIIDNFAKGRFSFEAVAQPIVIEEPAAVDQALNGLLHEGRVIIRLEDRETEVGGIDSALSSLHQAVQEGCRRNT